MDVTRLIHLPWTLLQLFFMLLMQAYCLIPARYVLNHPLFKRLRAVFGRGWEPPKGEGLMVRGAGAPPAGKCDACNARMHGPGGTLVTLAYLTWPCYKSSSSANNSSIGGGGSSSSAGGGLRAAGSSSLFALEVYSPLNHTGTHDTDSRKVATANTFAAPPVVQVYDLPLWVHVPALVLLWLPAQTVVVLILLWLMGIIGGWVGGWVGRGGRCGG